MRWEEVSASNLNTKNPTKSILSVIHTNVAMLSLTVSLGTVFLLHALTAMEGNWKMARAPRICNKVGFGLG